MKFNYVPEDKILELLESWSFWKSRRNFWPSMITSLLYILIICIAYLLNLLEKLLLTPYYY